MKKFLGTLLLAALYVTGFAQTEADFEVRLTADGQGAVIVKYIGRAVQVRIPATIQGMPVREIGTGEEDPVINDNVISVVIPVGVTRINDGAFRNLSGDSGHSKLASVTIPEGVTEIGDWAFGATALTSVILPKSLTSIGMYAFAGANLSSITIPPGVREIELNTFKGCSSLATVTLPEGLQSIGFWAFADCSSLTAVTFPESLQSIGGGAFENCSALTTVIYPDTIQITSLANSQFPVFDNCSKLTLASQAAIRKLEEIASAQRR
jgi:hypothetical protein